MNFSSPVKGQTDNTNSVSFEEKFFIPPKKKRVINIIKGKIYKSSTQFLSVPQEQIMRTSRSEFRRTATKTISSSRNNMIDDVPEEYKTLDRPVPRGRRGSVRVMTS